jgi:hypothetical protein
MADSILRTTYDSHGKCRDLLHAAKLRHGTDGFTSSPKEGMLRIFLARIIRRLQPGLNPLTWVPEASMLTTRPPTPLTALVAPTPSTAQCSQSRRFESLFILVLKCRAEKHVLERVA